MVEEPLRVVNVIIEGVLYLCFCSVVGMVVVVVILNAQIKYQDFPTACQEDSGLSLGRRFYDKILTTVF